MSSPRNLYPDTTLFVTCCCVHQSYRLVPTKTVNRVVKYAFSVMSSRYRDLWGMEFYEFKVLSTHYHLLLHDRRGKASDFIQDLNSLIARQLNAVRGVQGAFFNREPGIQTVVGEQRLFEHCIYTLANAVAAGIVHKAAHWEGFNSLRLEYGREDVVHKPHVGMWSRKQGHSGRKGAQRSGRAQYAGRSTLPETAVLKLDRPRIMLELSDAELRAKIREGLAEREAEIKRKRSGRPVVGMKAARKIHWSTVPAEGRELFDRQPTFSTETAEQRGKMKRLRRQFIREHREALDRWNAGERDVTFPAGTVRMRLRHNVRTEPTTLDVLLAA